MLICGMKAHLIDTRLVVPRSKVICQGQGQVLRLRFSENGRVREVFHKQILFQMLSGVPRSSVVKRITYNLEAPLDPLGFLLE